MTEGRKNYKLDVLIGCYLNQPLLHNQPHKPKFTKLIYRNAETKLKNPNLWN